jgi:hypothetical protein
MKSGKIGIRCEMPLISLDPVPTMHLLPPQYAVSLSLLERLRPIRTTLVDWARGYKLRLEAIDPLTNHVHVFEFTDRAIGASVWFGRCWN